MNHIHSLQIDLAAMTAQRDALLEGLQDIKIYLNSSKFSVDTTVQCADVMLRMSEIRDHCFFKGNGAAVAKGEEICAKQKGAE